MMEKLTAKIEEMVATWKTTEAKETKSIFMHRGAIQAAQLILSEIKGMRDGNNTQTLEAEVVPPTI